MIEVVHQSPAGRLNEDAWIVMQAGPMNDRIIFAAIDGATTRLTPPPLQHYLDSLPSKLTPAAFAARLTRDAIARQVAEGLVTELRSIMIEANADLGRALIRLFGALTLEGMDFPEEVLATLAHDPRLVRLGLPACTVTLAEYNPATRQLRYAHVGDSSLMIAYRDGRVIVPTQPDVPNYESTLRQVTLTLRKHHPDLPLRELFQQPEIKKVNLHNALYHNYVDEHGLPQPKQGIGVVDGLPELRYFIQAGKIDLDEALFVCAMTDGLEWPANAQEVFADNADEATLLMHERREFIADQIQERGLQSYLDMLRQYEADDADHERYPRFKTHDDATGVLLRLSE
jgi:hypothetical protein